MYEFHGWFGLSESTEESEFDIVSGIVDELRTTLATLDWPTSVARVELCNGCFYLILTGLVNRMRYEASDIDDLLMWVGSNLPGSYGILYERAADMPFPPGPDEFRVRVMARGRLSLFQDPWLSPFNPAIED